MNAWRVLGIGSPFGDDQVGWCLVTALESMARTAAPDGTGQYSVVALDRPGSGLIHALAGARGVIVVDAVQNMGQPGRIHRLSMAELTQASGHLSSHNFGVAEALALADELKLLPPHLLILAVEMSSAAPSEDVSPEVAAAVPELCTLINTTLMAWRSRSPTLNGEVKTCV
ncbi:MAG TPA: hydrogenase maturation protease [Marinobacter sp.]|nr:hydrogenase maturation protease [Marinobacter sp.]